MVSRLKQTNHFPFKVDFVVDALTCYVCDDSDYDDGTGCQGFNDTAPTENCISSDYCLSVYANQNDVDIELHSCAQDDELEGKYLLLV